MAFTKLFSTKPATTQSEPTRLDNLRAIVRPGEPRLECLYSAVHQRDQVAVLKVLEALIVLIADLPEPFQQKPFGFYLRQLFFAKEALDGIAELRPWQSQSGSEYDWYPTAICAGLLTGLEDIEMAHIGHSNASEWQPIKSGLANRTEGYKVTWDMRAPLKPGLYASLIIGQEDVRTTLGSSTTRQLWDYCTDPWDDRAPLGQVMQKFVGDSFAREFFDCLRRHVFHSKTQHNHWPGLTWVMDQNLAVALPGFLKRCAREPDNSLGDLDESDLLTELQKNRVRDIKHGLLTKGDKQIRVLVVPIRRVFSHGNLPKTHEIPDLSVKLVRGNSANPDTEGC